MKTISKDKAPLSFSPAILDHLPIKKQTLT